MSANTFQSMPRRWWRWMARGGDVARLETAVLRPGKTMILCQPGTVRVCQGAIWLTATPAKTDVILQAGEAFELKGDCPYVVEALREAKITMSQERGLMAAAV